MVNDFHLKAEEKLTCKDLNGIEQVAAAIIDFAGQIKVWLFKGDLGAGKTTLIKAIGQKFDITDNIQSPTFSLVNEYQNNNGEIFYHFDFYRIKDEEEAMDIGAEEYFYSGDYCFIEWPSKIPNLIPDQHLIINIEVKPDNSRMIGLCKYE